jgi:hypothetical protein
MAQRAVVTLTVTSMLAMIVAGCGTASTSSSTSRSHTVARSASVTPAAAPTHAIPAGFARYQGHGFSFIAPVGMKPAADGGVSGLPRGASVDTLTAGGRSVQSAHTQIMEGINPRLRTDVDLSQVSTSLLAADASEPSVKNLHTNISTMTVNGARDVRLVSESYTAPGGGRTRTLFRRTWLMVMPRRGILMDLVVIDEPQRGGRLDPGTVLDSFRLGGST